MNTSSRIYHRVSVNRPEEIAGKFLVNILWILEPGLDKF